MANLFKIEAGRMNALEGVLAEAGFTKELGEETIKNPALARVMVTAGLAALTAVTQKAVEMFTAFVNYLQPSFDELKKAFDWVNPDYTKVRFEPIERCKGVARTARDVVFHYFTIDRRMTTEEILDAMDAANLRPALYEELLAFASKYPDEQRKRLIAALGSVARLDDYLHVAYLDENGLARSLDLRCGNPGYPWLDDWFFLAVSK